MGQTGPKHGNCTRHTNSNLIADGSGIHSTEAEAASEDEYSKIHFEILSQREAYVPGHKRRCFESFEVCLLFVIERHYFTDRQFKQKIISNCRRIGGQKKNTLHNKANRPHLYAEAVNFVANGADESTGTLEVTGFLRGVPLNVNNLVHIPGLGDFQMSRIDAASDLYRMDKNR